MLAGHATAHDTRNYSGRFSSAGANGFFDTAGELTLSTLGIGTYLGGMDAQVDQGYAEAIQAALSGGVNVIDTSLNYRHQRSERCVSRAIADAVKSGTVTREEFVVCTKAGFLTPGAVPADGFAGEEIAGGIHSMSPGFLRDQLERSRANLGLATIDVYYLHNPETQLQFVSDEAVYKRIGEAFQCLEEMVDQGNIQFYGAATWQAFREDPGDGKGLLLGRLLELAWVAGGADHHFRFIQLPVNLAMPEGFTKRREHSENGPCSVLALAQEAGVSAVASATLLQGRLTDGLPEKIAEAMPETESDAERAIQFTRSTPGIAAALVGMSRPEHVAENLRITRFAPLPSDRYLRFYE